MTKVSAVARLVVRHMRAWAMLAWTGTIAAFIAELSSESPASTSDSFYGDVGAAAAQAAGNALIVLLVIVAWPLGLALIWLAALGWASLMRWYREAPERRRYWAELKERDRRARRGEAPHAPSFSWRRVGDQNDREQH
jgi:hypothetical protein